MFQTGKYLNPSLGTFEWAVLGPANVWYFPSEKGKRAAEALCRKMNEIECDTRLGKKRA